MRTLRTLLLLQLFFSNSFVAMRSPRLHTEVFMNLLLWKSYSNPCPPSSRRKQQKCISANVCSGSGRPWHNHHFVAGDEGLTENNPGLVEHAEWQMLLSPLSQPPCLCDHLPRCDAARFRNKSLFLISMFWFSAVRQTASALIKYLATGSMFSYEKKRCPVYVAFGCFFVPGTVPSIFLSLVTPWLKVM